MDWDQPSSDRLVRIHITLLDEEGGPERGERMAAALDRHLCEAGRASRTR